MINLRTKPFYLNENDIEWVNRTLQEMSLKEKIGQLFIMLDRKNDNDERRKMLQEYHIGGCRYEGECARKIYEQNKFYQEHCKIPVLIACNCDSGGNGACTDGTYIATAAACGAAADCEVAYQTGLVSGIEGRAVGCNWDFGPVCDILYNWRNTIVNTRAYGNDPDVVIENATAYIRGVQKSGMTVCCKHFPGDGVEELDQHLVMGINDLEPEAWDQSYGRVYKAMIDEGIKSIMAGHIALPRYSKKLRPEYKDEDILPATLSGELLNDLLRNRLGFNGLIVTDASHMAGLTTAKSRREQVPGAIAAGCDMFLFFNDIEEDYSYMIEGVRRGILTERRLDEAVTRILALKASIGLHNDPGRMIPKRFELDKIGCEAHKRMADNAADKSITLVKDTAHNLPVTPLTHKRAFVIVLSSEPLSREGRQDPVKEVIRVEMEAFGYETTMHDSYYDLVIKEGVTFENKLRSMVIGKVEEFKRKYDIVFVFINMRGYAQENNVRIKWSVGHSVEIPWYVREVPTIFVSLNYTNHLLDVPMAKTFINAYAPTRTVIARTLEKVAGRSEFKGRYNENVFCGRWDTRL